MKNWIFVIIIFVISSCNSNRIHNEFKELNEYLWYRTDIQNFDVEINEDCNYNILLAIRYVEGCPHQTLPIKMKYVSPSGKEEELSHEFIIKDENGDYQGGIVGNMCDIEDMLPEEIHLKETGTYMFSLSQETDQDPALLIMEIGLFLEKVSE